MTRVGRTPISTLAPPLKLILADNGESYITALVILANITSGGKTQTRDGSWFSHCLSSPLLHPREKDIAEVVFVAHHSQVVEVV